MSLQDLLDGRRVVVQRAPPSMRGVTPHRYTQSFASVDPLETVDLTFDWRLLLPGHSIVSVEIDFIPANGVDLVGTPVISGLETSFRVTGGLDGLTVEVVATAAISGGQVFRAAALLLIESVIEQPTPPFPPFPSPWAADFSNPNNSGAYCYLA